MTNYSVKLTPNIINIDTEGSMDTSLINGHSIQRTINVLQISDSNGNVKQINSIKDGEAFNDEVANLVSDSDS